MPYNALFLCTGNSARSIMAEGILRQKGAPLFHAFSAGSRPSGIIRPEALHQLHLAGIATTGLRSKSWDEFSQPNAPVFDFIFTVCDNAANEPCPFWPGHPATAHWGIEDPAAVQSTPAQIERAFHHAFTLLNRRITLFLALPLAALNQLTLKEELDAIGRLER
jgi:arsenate reductase